MRIGHHAGVMPCRTHTHSLCLSLSLCLRSVDSSRTLSFCPLMAACSSLLFSSLLFSSLLFSSHLISSRLHAGGYQIKSNQIKPNQTKPNHIMLSPLSPPLSPCCTTGVSYALLLSAYIHTNASFCSRLFWSGRVSCVPFVSGVSWLARWFALSSSSSSLFPLSLSHTWRVLPSVHASNNA
jgi:hypothetical protein